MSQLPGDRAAVAMTGMSLRPTNAEQGFRSPASLILAALARTATGIGALAVLAVAAPLPLWAIAACCAGAAVFALYGARAIIRHGWTVVIDEEGIERRGPFAKRLDWCDLTSVKLAHYSTRRDGRRGWQELVMRDGATALVLESEHPAFEPAAARALASATENGAEMSAATLHNANELGLWPGMRHETAADRPTATNGASKR